MASQTENLWNIIIVNQIPLRIDEDKFLSLFSEYGTIQNVDFSSPNKRTIDRHREFVRITFSTEEEAKKVWEASNNNSIKYEDHVLMITLSSNDYCPIEDLPANCLLEIFRYVTSVKDKMALESVSKKWKSISEKSWSTFIKMRDVDAEDQVILRAKNYMREVDVDTFAYYKEMLRLIAIHCTLIESIFVDFCLGDPEEYLSHLYTIIRQNHNLRRISFVTTKPDFSNPIHLTDISNKLQLLQCTSSEKHICLHIPKDPSTFRNLQVLILKKVDLVGIERKTFGNMTNLRKLTLKQSSVGSSSIEELAELTKLEHLSIPEYNLTDDILEKILKNNKKLQFLDVRHNHNITDASFKYVQQLPQLKVLRIDHLCRITDEYFSNMPTVRCITANGCTLITDGGVEEFLEGAYDLEQLEIRETNITLECIEIAATWTEATGERLELHVDEMIHDDYNDSDLFMIDQKVDMPYPTPEQYRYDDDMNYEGLCEETFNILGERRYNILTFTY